ncbi:MAG: TIGR04086 family membrane protein [Lachnospira sp.]|nr:TIGR04086 family membrane protein [Lachnospira sp.]
MTSKIWGILKILVVGLLITAVLLSVMALCVQNLGWGESQINIGIIVVYAVSSLVGGFLLAYREKKRRLVCGVAFGVLYFSVLFVGSLVLGRGNIDVQGMIKSLITCVVCGGIGGVLVK